MADALSAFLVEQNHNTQNEQQKKRRARTRSSDETEPPQGRSPSFYRNPAISTLLKGTAAKTKHEQNLGGQLACMWDNDWSFDFPPDYLANISDDATVGEDGVESFKQVDWIIVAREYKAWCEDTGHDTHIVQDGVTVGMLRDRFKAMALGVLQSKKRKNLTQQHKKFEHLSSLLDCACLLDS